jgi:hypothetical protein
MSSSDSDVEYEDWDAEGKAQAGDIVELCKAQIRRKLAKYAVSEADIGQVMRDIEVIEDLYSRYQ